MRNAEDEKLGSWEAMMLGSLEAEKLGGSEARKFTINEINLINPVNQLTSQPINYSL